LRPVNDWPATHATQDASPQNRAGSTSPGVENLPASWPTSGHIVYEGNGATSQHYYEEFQNRGLQGFQTSSGSGAKKHLALQQITADADSKLAFNGFSHNRARLIGFHARRREADGWTWLAEDGDWQDTHADLNKRLVKPNQDLSKFVSAADPNIVLVAQWVDTTGSNANSGSPMFSNKLMAHAFGGYRQNAYNNTQAAFEYSVEQGHTYFEVDLSYTSDERLIVSSPRTRTSGPGKRAFVSDLTYAQVMSLTTYGEPIMDARQLYELIREHPQYALQIDFHKVEGEEVKKRVRSLLDDFQHDEDVLSRLLIQVYSAQMHEDIDSVYGFANYQYLVGMRMDLLDSAITYSLDSGICALALRWGLATQEVIERVKAAGLFILTYTVVEEAAVASALVRSGVDTVCTDYVTPAMLEHATGQMGQNQFRIYYHSGVPEAIDSYSAAATRGTAERNIRTLKSGALEIPDTRCWQNDGAQLLRPLEFKVQGKRFAGWRMRIKIDNGIRWYCADGTFRTKKELGTTPPVRRYVFSDQEALPPIAVVEDSSVVMEATWEPASRIVRVLKRWYRKCRK
jgi:glycerophosphoryl diester phosphodiesterase